MKLSIRQFLLLVFISSIAGLVVIIGLAVVIWYFQLERSRLRTHGFESHRLANELYHSSQELTRTARSFVVTGDPAFEKEYWHILAVRNGEKPRPDGRQVPLRHLIDRMVSDPALLELLHTSENNSNALVETERIAMNLVHQATTRPAVDATERRLMLAEARQMMFDRAYHEHKQSILGPIGRFGDLQQAQVDEQIVQTTLWRDLAGLSMFAIALLMVLLWLAFVWLVFAKVIKPLTHGAMLVRRISSGDWSVRWHVSSANELGELASSFNDMVDRIHRHTIELDASNQTLRHEIVEREQIQKQLIESQALMHAAIEQSQAGVIIADAPDLRIRLANAVALGIRGHTEAVLTDIPLEQRVHDSSGGGS